MNETTAAPPGAAVFVLRSGLEIARLSH